MNVHWTKTAEDHLDAIYAYIAQDSPEYVLRVVDRKKLRSDLFFAVNWTASYPKRSNPKNNNVLTLIY